MTKSKKPKPNPIEEAIGDRAKTPKPIPQNPSEIPDEPTPSEMQTLEELNRQTEERLRDEPKEEAQLLTPKDALDNYEDNLKKVLNPPVRQFPKTITHVLAKTIPVPVSKPDPQPVTKTSSEESPPQKKVDMGKLAKHINDPSNNECPDCKVCVHPKTTPAEDVELTALRKYILEDGFVLATVAFHIVSLCAQPMTTPSTTTWNFKDRAMVPEMVLALLNQPGYLEGIWPSLKVVMGSNVGNAAWCAGIATTIAFFDTIRVIPTLKELQIEKV